MGWCNTTSRVAPTALFRQGFTEASSLALPGKTWKKKVPEEKPSKDQRQQLSLLIRDIPIWYIKRYTYLVYQVLIYQIGISQLHTIQGPPKTSDIAIDLSKCTL